MRGAIPPLPQYDFVAWCSDKRKHRDNFTLPYLRSVIAQSAHRLNMGWTIGVLGFDFRRGLGIFLFTIVSRTALEPTQPPIQWVWGVLSLGIKRPGREADHLPLSSVEVKNVWGYTSAPNTPPCRGAQLKHRDNFRFTFYLTLPCRRRVIWLRTPPPLPWDTSAITVTSVSDYHSINTVRSWNIKDFSL
jgi:hypothetical protein